MPEAEVNGILVNGSFFSFEQVGMDPKDPATVSFSGVDWEPSEHVATRTVDGIKAIVYRAAK
jgi:hypothetical protein